MDDLTKIKGIGKKRADQLNGIGIKTFDDIIGLSPARATELDEALELRGSIDRDDWRADAERLKKEAAEKPEGETNDEGSTESTETGSKVQDDTGTDPLKPSEGAKDESFTEDSSDLENLKQNTSDEPFGGADVKTSVEDPAAKAHYGAGAPVPRGAVAAGGEPDYTAPGAPYTPDRPFSPDEDVERALAEAQNDAEATDSKAATIDESRGYAHIVGSVEGYSEAVRYEQDEKMFNAQKREVKRSR